MSQAEVIGQSTNGRVAEKRPDPEVVPKAKRRRFTAEYKLAVVREAERCSQPGQIGALLRREGLYSSHLSDWRRQVALGELSALAPTKRGPKPSEALRQAAELARVQRENARLRERLRQTEAIIAAQKKLAELLGQPLDETPTDGWS
jgi:transposase-like protein